MRKILLFGCLLISVYSFGQQSQIRTDTVQINKPGTVTGIGKVFTTIDTKGTGVWQDGGGSTKIGVTQIAYGGTDSIPTSSQKLTWDNGAGIFGIGLTGALPNATLVSVSDADQRMNFYTGTWGVAGGIVLGDANGDNALLIDETNQIVVVGINGVGNSTNLTIDDPNSTVYCLDKNGGNFGIGTSTPSTALDVLGKNCEFTVGAAPEDGRIIFKSNDKNNLVKYSWASNGSYIETVNADNSIGFMADSFRLTLQNISYITPSASGNGPLMNNAGVWQWGYTQVSDSIAATGATITAASGEAHSVASAGAITSLTLAFPAAVAGNYFVITFSKAATTVTISGTRTGTVGTSFSATFGTPYAFHCDASNNWRVGLK